MLKIVVASLVLLFATAPQAQTAQPDPLLNRLIGTWVLRGTIGGKQVVHDVTSKWVLGGEYVELREVSREKSPNGAPAYEAIMYLVRDPLTREYVVLWLDNTAPSTFTPLGRGLAAGDSIPFVWTMSPTERIHNTFVYQRATNRWEWHIDNEDAKGVKMFARVVLSRQ